MTPKQTKFTDMITSSNNVRMESEKQRETIDSLTKQVSELTREQATASDKHYAREKELLEENKATSNKLISMETVYKKLSSEYSELQLQHQEVKDELHGCKLVSSEQKLSLEKEISCLKESLKKQHSENEELLESWDKLRIQNESNKETLQNQEEELSTLRKKQLELEAQNETLKSDVKELEERHSKCYTENKSLKNELNDTKEALSKLRASLME